MTMAKTKENQGELVEAAHVKFTGMSGSALDKPAELGDTQTFEVTAKCVGVGVELRKDGEVRHTRKMEVQEVEFGEIVKAPKEKGLFAVPGDDSDDDGTEV